jgi:predicted type IV restriction endonuclease
MLTSDTAAVTVAAATADTLITVNDAQADSVTYASGQRIGACLKVISNGTYWIVVNEGSTTMTVTT